MKLKSITQPIAILSVVLALGGCATTGQYFDDSWITTKVKSALINDPAGSGGSVNVETFKGTVQLSGFVKSSAERDQAVKTARAVPGVKEIKNDIVIR